MMDITERMERAFAELPSVRMGPYESRQHAKYDYGDFLRSIIAPNILVALHRARDARELAVSYRDFNVGAAVVALTNHRARFQILPGINAKTEADGALNMHAEQLALRTAASANTSKISVITVVGETQPDQQSGHEMHTLHPCGKCRKKLYEHPLIDNDATLVFSALPDLRTIQAGTIAEYMAYHDLENPDPSDITLFEFPDLQLLQPVSPSEASNGVLHLDDSDRLMEEDRLWASTIGRYALEHQMRVTAQRNSLAT